MRWILVAGLIVAVAASAGCVDPLLGEAKLVFVNQTDSRLCYTSSPSARDCLDPVKADGRTVWRPECRSGIELSQKGYVKGRPVGVVLFDEGGRQIYSGTARCDEETRFVIERDGDKFVVSKTVTKTLLNESPSP